jgi:predicted Zn-dependent peptidase
MAGVSQEKKPLLETEIYKLDNGLTVYLNEDHSLPSVMGAIAVKGGSKRDPADATGIAHYFEHIMFKGTDHIGTLDYETEKIYLDSIAVLYDQLARLEEEEQREKIQMKINRLSLRAAEFSIPNELDKIISDMGGTSVNAFTSNEEIVYFNTFPGNQVEKWMKVYSDRFNYPVYRLFQSELETVYEEYNMYKDDRFSNAFEEFNQAIYPDHPYGIPVIGYPDHLKNPSMSKMNEYFQTYYVANNMALILTGNFETAKVKPMIEQYFGNWRTGEIPPMPAEYKIRSFEGRNVVEQRLTPVKLGIRAYRTVPVGHPDSPALNIIGQMLSNQSQTGLLDQLVVENKLLGASGGAIRYTEAGTDIILFIPKIIGQSLPKAEKMVETELEKIKSGEFEDEFLEAVKTEICVNFEKNFEDQFQRGYMMFNSFVKDTPWNELLDYPEKIRKISKEEIIQIAGKYYGEDYLVFYSKTGFPKKPATLKPSFEPIPALNTELHSEFAVEIENMPVLEMEPDFIEFGPDGDNNYEVTISDVDSLVHLYYVKNEVNDLFNIDVQFGIGSYEMPIAEQLSDYMELIGTQDMPLRELSNHLQKLGANYYFYADEGEFNLSISGPDEHIGKILELITGLLYNPMPDDTKLKNLLEYAKANREIESDDPETLGYALYCYAVYDNKSPFLNRLSENEIKTQQHRSARSTG